MEKESVKITNLFVLLAALSMSPQTTFSEIDLIDAHLKTRELDEAHKKCQDLGARMPTVRELAHYTTALGAQGIIESAHKEISLSDDLIY